MEEFLLGNGEPEVEEFLLGNGEPEVEEFLLGNVEVILSNWRLKLMKTSLLLVCITLNTALHTIRL